MGLISCHPSVPAQVLGIACGIGSCRRHESLNIAGFLMSSLLLTALIQNCYQKLLSIRRTLDAKGFLSVLLGFQFHEGSVMRAVWAASLSPSVRPSVRGQCGQRPSVRPSVRLSVNNWTLTRWRPRPDGADG